jgi:hypothetical protein
MKYVLRPGGCVTGVIYEPDSSACEKYILVIVPALLRMI